MVCASVVFVSRSVAASRRLVARVRSRSAALYSVSREDWDTGEPGKFLSVFLMFS